MTTNPPELPLAAARVRLAGKRGRPPRYGPPSPKPAKVKPGHTPGIADAESGMDSGRAERAPATYAVVPRLLNVPDAARYLGVFPRSIRTLYHSGRLAAIRLPGGDGGDMRRLLFDRHDLDALVEASRQVPTYTSRAHHHEPARGLDASRI